MDTLPAADFAFDAAANASVLVVTVTWTTEPGRLLAGASMVSVRVIAKAGTEARVRSD